MAPPNRYTNSSRSITGRASEVRMASRLRLVRRRQRPAMVDQSPRAASGRTAGRRPGAPAGDAMSSGNSGLLVVLGSVGGVAGQGQEHVVEGGPVHGEPVDGPAGRVDLVEQGPHL